MRFRAYRIKRENNGEYSNVGEIDVTDLIGRFNQFEKREKDNESIYKPMYVHREQDLLLATFIQTYRPDLKTFSDSDYKEEVNISEKFVNDRVLFYINLREKVVYIQNKRYQSSVLKHARTVDRIRDLIATSMQDESVCLIPLKIDYSIDEVDAIFQESNVQEMHFTNLAGLEIPEDAKIHNPMREWDCTVAKSWNRYSKEDLNSIDLKAAPGKTLSKNPIARLCMILAKQGNPNGKPVFKNMKIISNGDSENISLSGNENKVYNISKTISEDSYEAYDCIIKKNYSTYNGRFDDERK